MADCLFCGIAAKRIPSTIVAESEKSLAFRDIHPKAPVHVLVIPKAHIPSIMDVTSEHSEKLSDIHALIRRVAELEKVVSSGFRVVVNNGPDAGQIVGHLDYHVLGGRKL